MERKIIGIVFLSIAISWINISQSLADKKTNSSWKQFEEFVQKNLEPLNYEMSRYRSKGEKFLKIAGMNGDKINERKKHDRMDWEILHMYADEIKYYLEELNKLEVKVKAIQNEFQEIKNLKYGDYAMIKVVGKYEQEILRIANALIKVKIGLLKLHRLALHIAYSIGEEELTAYEKITNPIPVKGKTSVKSKAEETKKELTTAEDFFWEGIKLSITAFFSSDYIKVREPLFYFQKAVKKNPRYAEAYVYIGLCYKELGLYTKAISTCKQAIHIEPNNVSAHFELGQIYMKFRDFDSAMNEYKILMDLDKEKAHLLFLFIESERIVEELQNIKIPKY